ncbi:FecCD family ABC transporter permease [Paenibacillus montanisoli]|uniref:Iron ABC transporter permease n=1 Tax=Paenibacillus montanisoli TaxID=2081970 RepID=A0A328TTM8_9BACL|nr:iron ABC transporter permease [Paenibacillus montanisoli]RAP73650.1 iron ABC transporter permease [Paenibacillus montanisoli]
MISSSHKGKQNRPRFLLFLFSVLVALLAIGILCSLKWGQAPVSWGALWDAVSYRTHDKTSLYIQTLRLPRALLACMVGVQLALAGLLTQLLVKNPLASPHILGINAGAAFAVVFGLVAFADLSMMSTVAFAFFGAAGGAALVLSLAGTSRNSYVRMALAGITIHFLLSALTEGLIILNQETTDSMIFWLVGSVSQAAWKDVQLLLPFFAAGLILAFFMLPSFKLLQVDEEISIGIGGRLSVIRIVGMLLVLLLAGSAVALCGPIGFVCLIVPHIARSLVGGRLTVLLPLTGLLGGVLLVYADFVSRFIAFPYESPVGLLTSAIGAAFFIYLARRNGGAAA